MGGMTDHHPHRLRPSFLFHVSTTPFTEDPLISSATPIFGAAKEFAEIKQNSLFGPDTLLFTIKC